MATILTAAGGGTRILLLTCLAYLLGVGCFLAAAIISLGSGIRAFSGARDWCVAAGFFCLIASVFSIRLVGLLQEFSRRSSGGRRLVRRAKIGFVSFAALVFLLSLALWVGTFLFQYGDMSQEHGFAAIDAEGKIALAFNTRSEHPGADYAYTAWPVGKPMYEVALYFIVSGDNGFGGFHSAAGFLIAWGSVDYPFVVLGVPDWSIAVAAASPLVYFVFAHRRRQRRASNGLCRICGYDLRSSPLRCPECGEQHHGASPATDSVFHSVD